MKKLLPIIASILLFTIPCFATSYDNLGIGDSIQKGIMGATNGGMPTLNSYDSRTYINRGAGGTCSDGAVTNLPTWLASDTPTRVYSNYGINDIAYHAGCAMTRASWLSNYSTILSDVTGASATLYTMQITPSCSSFFGGTYINGTLSQEIKIWNAHLEDFAYTNSLNTISSFLEMSDPASDDCLNSAYNDIVGGPDGVHPSSVGDAVLGYLMYKSAVPTRSRDWGSSSYPTFGHESFSWWVITGGSLVGGDTDAVTGNKNGGTLTLGSSDSAVSPVLAILPPVGKTISISTTGTVGTTYYRHSASNFTRTAVSPSWTAYTGTVTPISAGTAEFFQTEYSGISAVTLSTLNWNVAGGGDTPAASSGIISGGSSMSGGGSVR